MHGQVVQAIQGQRQHYRAIQSSLTDSHALLDVVDAILQVYAFDCFYIADLNAITRQPDRAHHRTEIQQAMRAFPGLTWWVDAGIANLQAITPWLDLGIQPILASESLPNVEVYQSLRQRNEKSILSLDFFQEGFRGPEALAADTALWTQPTIVMSLPSVGANLGPDTAQMTRLKTQHPQQSLYAAGGVRDMRDIQQLTHAGADGVLIASALHQGRLTGEQLRTLHT